MIKGMGWDGMGWLGRRGGNRDYREKQEGVGRLRGEYLMLSSIG